MKRSSLVSIALLACAALASVAVATYDRAASVAVAAYASVKAFVLDGVALLAGTSDGPKSPVVFLVQAKAFVLRLAKRERPVVTASWRLCPSI
ncbi:MAG: hypothetical protein WAW73_20350 [Rhodoferax sp.]